MLLENNLVVDYLSRAIARTVHLGTNYTRMAADQATDPDMQAFRTAITGLQWKDVAFDEANTSLLCDVSTGQPWPIVLVGWKWQVFEAVHGLSHPGRKPSKKTFRPHLRNWSMDNLFGSLGNFPYVCEFSLYNVHLNCYRFFKVSLVLDILFPFFSGPRSLQYKAERLGWTSSLLLQTDR